MGTSVDATLHFDQQKIKDMESLVAINEELKKLEAKKKDLVELVKQHMLTANIDKVDVNGSTIMVTESERRTVTKATKDQFIAELVSMNKKHLVIHTLDPDVDSIFAEVDAGTLPKDFVDKYIKVSSVKTLRCN